ncbi:MAG: calcium-binding protein [Bacillota bacterium]
MISGGAGNDVYRFAVGDGQDVISDTGGTDTAVFGATDLRLMMDRLNDDLVLSTAGATDQVTVKDWYKSDSNKIETIQSSNGRQLLAGQVNSLIQTMAQLQAEKGMSWNELINSAPSETQTVLNQFWTEKK